MAHSDVLREAQQAGDFAHLVLEEGAEGFDQFEVQVFGEAADVVVALDVGCARFVGVGAACGFDHVGVQGALGQEVEGAEFRGFPLEGADEFTAYDLAFLFGVVHARQFAEELLAGVHRHQVHAEGFQGGFHLFAFAQAQESMVDEHGGQALTHRLGQQQRQR